MTLLYLYCGLCWLYNLYKLWKAINEQLDAGLLHKTTWVKTWRTMQEFVLAPLMVTIDLFIGSLCWVLTWRERNVDRARRCYREYEYEPVDSGDITADVWAFFDEHTEPLYDLGFRVIGDYWLWEEPLPYLQRALVSSDGRMFAAIDMVEEIRCLAFYSVLTDGSYLETAMSLTDEPLPSCGPDASGQLQAEVREDVTVEGLFRHHDRRLDHATCEAICYDARDVRNVAIYGSRLAGQRFYEQGFRNEAPPPAEPPRPRLPCAAAK